MKEKHILTLRFNLQQSKKTIKEESLNVDILEFWCLIRIDDIEKMSERVYNICLNTSRRSKKERAKYFISKMRQLDITFNKGYKRLIEEELQKQCFVSYGIHPLNELNIYNPPI